MATRHPLILSIYISLNISPLHDHLKKGREAYTKHTSPITWREQNLGYRAFNPTHSITHLYEATKSLTTPIVSSDIGTMGVVRLTSRL